MKRQKSHNEQHQPAPGDTPSEPKPRTWLVRWKCPDCGVTICGWIEIFDYTPRICRGIPRGAPIRDERGKPEVCGAVMSIIHDDRRAA